MSKSKYGKKGDYEWGLFLESIQDNPHTSLPEFTKEDALEDFYRFCDEEVKPSCSITGMNIFLHTSKKDGDARLVLKDFTQPPTKENSFWVHKDWVPILQVASRDRLVYLIHRGFYYLCHPSLDAWMDLDNELEFVPPTS